VEQTGKRGRVHGYSFPPSAHSIPCPVACSWTETHTTVASKRIAEKGTRATAGRPPCGWKVAQRRPGPRAGGREIERGRELGALYSLFKAWDAHSPPPSEPNESKQTSKGQRRVGEQRRAGKPSVKAPAAPSLASSWLLAAGEALAALSPPPISLR